GGFVGISKLCCAKCYLAIEALQSASDIRLHVQGAHFKTYATRRGWPMPRFLRENSRALQAFLGAEGHRLYLANPAAARAIVEREALDVPSFRDTEMVSSGEERESTGGSSDGSSSGDDSSSAVSSRQGSSSGAQDSGDDADSELSESSPEHSESEC